MKRIISLLVILTLAPGINARIVNTPSASGSSTSIVPDKNVTVYYFHFTRRCMTCLNVEKVSKEAVENQFTEQVKKGDITFKSINLDEKEGEAIGAKYKIEGQTLIVICGDKKIDLTEKGFMYANNSPEKLSAEIKKAIDGLLK